MSFWPLCMWAWHYLNLQNALAVLIRGSVAIVLTSRFSQRRCNKYLCFSSSAICTPTDCWYNFYHLLSGIIAFGLLLHFHLTVTEGSSFCFMFFFEFLLIHLLHNTFPLSFSGNKNVLLAHRFYPETDGFCSCGCLRPSGTGMRRASWVPYHDFFASPNTVV